MSRRYGVIAWFVGCVTVASLLVPGASAAAQDEPPPAAGSDAAIGTSPPPADGPQPGDPVVDAASFGLPEQPAPGTEQRRRLDEFAAATKAETDALMAREFPTRAVGEPNPASVVVIGQTSEDGTVTTAPSEQPSSTAAENGAEQQAVDPCAEFGDQPWFARYDAERTFRQTPTTVDAGKARLFLVNEGSQTWPAGRTYVGYRLYLDDGVTEVAGNYPRTVLPTAVGPGQTVTVDATVAPLRPGFHRVSWDILIEGVGWFTDLDNCDYTVRYEIPNQPPSITLQSPPNNGTVFTRTPTLYTLREDRDLYPDVNPSVEFRVCRDAAMTAGCRTSTLSTSAAYTIPAGFVGWNETFWWTARVTDGALFTPPSGFMTPSRVTVVVPLPDAWRTVGNGQGMINHFGLALPHGIFVHPEVDAEVNGYGQPLRITRTYSSGAATVAGAFGLGWLSLFDASALYSPDNQQITITFPDGRAENFGRQGTGWVTALGTGVTDRLTVAGDGVITVRTSGQEVLRFGPAGELRAVETTGLGALRVERNPRGLVSRLLQEPSGRSLTVGWSSDPSATCTAVIAVICSIASEAPAAGTSALVWRYRYDRDRLQSACDPMNRCTSYSMQSGVFGAYAPGGRGVVQPYFPTWQPGPNNAPWEYLLLSGQAAGSGHYSVVLRRARMNRGADYKSTMNSFGGRVVTVHLRQANGSLSVIPSAAAQIETYRFDELNRVRTLIHGTVETPDTEANTRRWGYDATGDQTDRLRSFIDENGNVMEFQYDGYGNQIGHNVQRDPATTVLRSSKYLPVAAGSDETRMVDVLTTPNQGLAGDNTEMFGYDSVGRLVRRTDHFTPEAPSGAVTNYTYTSGNEMPVGLRRGGNSSATRVPAGLPLTVQTPAGMTRFGYNVQGDLTEVTGPTGRRLVYDYDDVGRRVSSTEFSDTFPAGVVTRLVLDPAGQVIEEIHPASRNEVTGAVIQKRVCRSYHADGLLARVVETGSPTCPAAGAARRTGDRTTDYGYDSVAGRLDRLVDPGGAETRWFYNPISGGPYDEQVVMQDALGGRHVEYFDNGRLMRVEASTGPRGGTAVATWDYTYDPGGRRIKERDPLGRETWLDWTGDDLNNRAIRITGPAPQPGTFYYSTLFERTFDGAGRVTSEVTGNGKRRVEAVYDMAGKLVDTILDPAGLNRRTHRSYDQAGRVVQVDLTGAGETRQARYSYDPSGALLSSTVENGAADLITRTLVDQRGIPYAVYDPRAAGSTTPDLLRTTFRTDELGRRVSVTGPPVTVEAEGSAPTTERPAVTTGYNVFGEVTHVRDARGLVTETVYDDAGRVTEARAPPYTPPGSTTTIVPATRWRYNLLGEVIEETDARGGVTTIDYDHAGNPVTVTGPDAGSGRPVQRYRYDAAGQVIETTDPGGAVARYGYNVFGDRTSMVEVVRQPSGAPREFTTTYRFDRLHNLDAINGPGSFLWFGGYNAASELIGERLEGVGRPTEYSYNLVGQLTNVTDPVGRRTVVGYDRAGRQNYLSHLAPNGAVLDESRAEYDVAGNLVAEIDPRGTRTLHTFDILNRLVRTSQPVSPSESIVTTAGYDIAGNLVRDTDGNNNSTWATYNTLGLPEHVTEPATAAHPALGDRRWTTGYDAAGLPVRQDKPGGVSVARTFDAHGRLTGEQASGGGAPQAQRAFRYDISGRLAAMRHASGNEQTFQWSDRGLLLNSYGLAGAAVYDYDADGRVTVRSDSAGVATFSWRPDGQLARATDSLTGQNHTFGYNYDSGDLVSINRGGNVTTWGREGRGLVNSVTTVNAAGATLSAVNYVYDTSGNVTTKQVTAGAAGAGGSYSYDLADRLTYWQPQGARRGHRYEWDAAGNRRAEEIIAESGYRTAYTYDQRNRLVTATATDDVGSQLVTTFGHTPRGTLERTTRDGAASLTTFDGLDRLVADDRGGSTYAYDSFDRLATSRSGGTDREFTYSGFQPDPTTVGTSLFSRDPGGEVLATRRAGATTFLTTDARGDVTGSHTPQSTFAAGNHFDPFGATLYGPPATGVGFQGDWTDPTTGLVHMHARWYDPSTATFLSRDSVDSGNRYSYGAANPMRYTDPDGHFVASVACRAAGQAHLVLGTTCTGAAIGSYFGPKGALIGAGIGLVIGGGITIAEMFTAPAPQRQYDFDPITGEPLYPQIEPEVDRPGKPGGGGQPGGGGKPGGAGGGAGAGGGRPPGPVTPPTPFPVNVSTQQMVQATVSYSSYSEPGHTNSQKRTDLEYLAQDITTMSNGARIASAVYPTGFGVILEDTDVYTYAIPFHESGRGYRCGGVDNYTDTYKTRRESYSNGAWSNSGAQLDNRSVSRDGGCINTVDPGRVRATVTGSIDPGAGLASAHQADDSNSARCGLTGTVTSCLAEILTSPVGAACATPSATMQSCIPTEPGPGNAGGQREAAAALVSPTNTSLDGACATGGRRNSDGTRSAMIWQCEALALPMGPWGEKVVQARGKLPDAWGPGVPNRKKVGTRWFDPVAPEANGVRIDRGSPASRYPSQRIDHVVVRSGGRILGPGGQPIVGRLEGNPEAHIPLSDWLGWRSWNTP